jgi:hypothetical protein
VSDSLGIADVETAVATFLGNISESIAIAEAQVAVLIMTITETMATSDSTTVGTYYQEFLAELVAIIDNPQATTAYNVNTSDTMVLTDSNSGRILWEIIDDTEVANWQNISNPQTPGWGAVDTTESPGWTVISTQ